MIVQVVLFAFATSPVWIRVAAAVLGLIAMMPLLNFLPSIQQIRDGDSDAAQSCASDSEAYNTLAESPTSTIPHFTPTPPLDQVSAHPHSLG